MIHIKPYNEHEHYPLILSSVTRERWQSFYEERKSAYREALQSSCTLVAYDGDRYAGFLRAITDGVFTIFVAEIVVEPEVRRKGVGTALLGAASEQYPSARIDLISDEDGFYAKNGFHRVGNGMRRHDWY